MKHTIATFVLCCLWSCHVNAQQDHSATIYGNTITTVDLKEHLSILASDSLEGRETGTRGQKMAASYIENQFRSYELKPLIETPSGLTYIQSFDLVKIAPATSRIKVGGQQFEGGKDFYFSGSLDLKNPEKASLIFVGAGNLHDYLNNPVKGKSVLLYCECNREQIKEKVALAKTHGAPIVFIMKSGTDQEFARSVNAHNNNVNNGRLSLPVDSKVNPDYFVISPSMGELILNADQKKIAGVVAKMNAGKSNTLLTPQQITFDVKQSNEKVSTENVLGMVEGSDKKNEYIIVTAHYDHIGMVGDEVNNGADDDGSGTVAVLEMAQAFAMAKKEGHGPRRSIIFMTVTGEEKGLLGSTYYVANPVVPLENTVSNLNIDMIGRIDDKHAEKPDYVYLIGSDKLSSELHTISENTNATHTKLELDYTFNATNDPNRFYYRSDHYNFAKNNIPVIFYFNGTHADYHMPTDTIEKINFEQLEKRAKLVFYTAWTLANRDNRIKLNVTPEELKLDSSQ